MKCTVHESIGIGGKLIVTVFLEPETTDEAFYLGTLGLRMRTNDLWNVMHYDKAMLEVMLK